MYNKILVPVDGSELAERVLPYATGLAARLDLKIDLLRVCSPANHEMVPQHREYVESIAGTVEKQAKAIREATATKLPSEPIRIVEEVFVGYAAEEILRYAEQEDIDIICMATHGHSRIKRWALGSVAAKVLRKSPIPVLLVPANITDDFAHRHWPFNTILVPLDGSALAEGVLPHVELLAKQGNDESTEIILVQVCESPFITADYPEAIMPLTWEEHVEYMKSAFKQGALKYIEEVEDRVKSAGLKVRSEVLMGKPADQIIEYTHKNAIGLTAMSTHGYSGVTRWAYGSVADKVLHRIHNPILLVRPR